ncbi:hypothetical protein [Kitasatospora sp. NPDC087314]|uniref:hypothetical protein n=1 Tax=Kitasatospora sp. NPDC087314 TaxID=3364068 RepID=UPI0037F3A781
MRWPGTPAVADGAHRTTGSEGKAQAAVHDDDQVPAARRPYVTATPHRRWPAPTSWASAGPHPPIAGLARMHLREGVVDPYAGDAQPATGTGA